MIEPRAGAGEGELTVSVGGTTVVATDVVLAQAELLRYTHTQAGEWKSRVTSIRALGSDGPSNRASQETDLPLHWAEAALGQLEQRSDDLVVSLMDAAERYGRTERAAMQLAVLGSAKLGYDLGLFRNLVLLLSVGPAAKAAQAWRSWAGGGTHSPQALDPRFITNPAVVLLTKLTVSSLDEVVAGGYGIPLPVALALGNPGMGLTGATGTALGVLALGRSGGRFREGPVSVAAVGAPVRARPPKGVRDLAANIPKAVEGQPQVRIERYGSPGNWSWAVYVGGTVDWDSVARTEPWDLTANISAMAKQKSGSYEAVMEAMDAAGITAGDPVVIAGHSQGGLIATQVAASGAFDVQAVVTLGAPESPVPVPPGVATLTVEHTDDIVTAFGGASLIDSDDRVTVRREAFVSAPLPEGEVLPAHHLDTYRETARLIDASPETTLQGFRDTVTGIIGSEPGEAVLWRGIRLPEGPTPQ